MCFAIIDSNMEKIAVVVWTIDPDGNNRFLLRHNRPFDGYEDEWTILFGTVEENEELEETAIRETGEEYGINQFEVIKNLNYKIEYEDKGRQTIIHFFGLKVKSIDIPIQLNGESIGYDWMTYEQATAVMKNSDESIALSFLDFV